MKTDWILTCFFFSLSDFRPARTAPCCLKQLAAASVKNRPAAYSPRSTAESRFWDAYETVRCFLWYHKQCLQWSGKAVNEPNLQEEERIRCKISVFLVSFLVFSFFIALFASIATEVDVVAVILDSSLCFQMMYTDRVRIQLHANPNSSHINCVAWFIVNME